MREVLPVKLATVNLIALAKAAAWDIEGIKRYAVAEGYSKTHAITDLVPFMISAITNNWEYPVTMDEKETEEYSMAKIKDTLGYNDVILMNSKYQDTLDAFPLWK